MRLRNTEDLEKAIKILKDSSVNDLLAGDSLDSRPRHLRISLKGLKPMQTATKTRVLYADPEDIDAHLRPFCEAIRSAFDTAGLLVDSKRELKLHATIVNTVYARHRSGFRYSKDGTFDATRIIEETKDFVWCKELILDRLCICEMGAEKIKNEAGDIVDHRYKEIATIPLPS